MNRKRAIVIIICLLGILNIILVTLKIQENTKLDNINENVNIENKKDDILDIESLDKDYQLENKEDIIKIEENKNEISSVLNNQQPIKENDTLKENNSQEETSSKKENIKKEETTEKNESFSKDDSSLKEENQPEEKPFLISTEQKKDEETLYKYGVKITNVKTYTLDTYSDGSVIKKDVNTKTVYDKSGFNATTKDLKSEANTIASKNKAIYEEIANYVNDYRLEVNKSALILNDELSLAATIRALEMAWSGEYMDISHTRPNGSSCFTVYEEIGYYAFAMGENIAAGYNSAKSVSEGWKNSKGHYANMISDNFGKIGIGMVELSGTKYWVQLFSN